VSPPFSFAVDSLTRPFDVALLDLDGVIYVGSEPVEGAADALAAVRAQGMRLAFVTNNAARPPATVAEHLTRLGVPANSSDVITSAQAAARYLAERLAPGATVLVVGTIGLDEALREQDLVPVHSADEQSPQAVVQGYSPSLDWAQLAEGAVGIRRGLPWVATNLDATVPSPRGPLPGNGSMVAALRHATGLEPVSTGKPDPTMHRESVIRSHARRPLVVGDRLDTDIEGATAAGCPSLLVLTGVTDASTLLAAAPGSRPTFVARDLSGLLESHPAVRSEDGGSRCGRWQVRVDGPGGAQAVLTLRRGSDNGTGDGDRATGDGDGATGDGDGERTGGPPTDDDMDALRALCAAAWAVSDATAAGSPSSVHGADREAQAVLARLGLAEKLSSER
jgi:HAD superfamily hydrolase (TIGR01450 family)